MNLETGRLSLAKQGERITKKRRLIVPIFPEIREDLETLVAAAKHGWLFNGPGIEFYHRFRVLCERR
jgi:hypothetical protein